MSERDFEINDELRALLKRIRTISHKSDREKALNHWRELARILQPQLCE